MLKKGSVLQMHNHPQYERRGQRHHPGSVLKHRPECLHGPHVGV